MKDKKILRGDMFYANLGRGIGSEQKRLQTCTHYSK